jgi:prepilin-type N-terminal cleavage/methylation domain-containing protein
VGHHKLAGGKAVRDSAQGGFTLIEMTIAIAVILVGLIAIAGISVYVSRANTVSNYISVLATSAQGQIDLLRSAQWTKAAEDPRLTVGGSLDQDLPNHFAKYTDTALGSITVRWQVRQGPTPDMRYLTVRAMRQDAPALLRGGLTVTTILVRE